MSVALHGNLRDFGIAEVFQLIGQQRKTGTLTVEGESHSIFLAFDEGRVVRGGPLGGRTEREPLGPQLVRAGYLTRDQLEDLRVESERSARPIADLLLGAGLIESETLGEVQYLLTRETVFDVMRRKSGDFQFTAEAIVHDTPPEKLLGAEQILMDGLRMLDEWQTFAAIVPSDDIVFRRVGELDAARALTKGDSDARLGHADRVLQLVDGRLSVRRIVDLSRIGTFEATRALAELRQAGVIEMTEPARKKAPRAKSSAPKRPLLPILRAAMATVLPLALLGWLGATMLERADGAGGLAGAAIRSRAVAELGLRYEADTIRQGLERFRFERGGYPRRLDELVMRGEGGLGALTPERLGEYYYALRGDDVVLLPPIE